jgi:uracil-DNA glycosylase
MTHAERRAALEAIATEVRGCTRCKLAAGRTNAVPGEGSPDTEVVFVGEGPGFNEDRLGRPFVGRAGVPCGNLTVRKRDRDGRGDPRSEVEAPVRPRS